jgi:hypothetical protein
MREYMRQRRAAQKAAHAHEPSTGDIAALQSRIAELKRENATLRQQLANAVSGPGILLEWEIEIGDEGYISAYEEPYGLYVWQWNPALFCWQVFKDAEDEDKDGIDVAEGEASSLVAAMAAAELAATTAGKGAPAHVREAAPG